MTKIRLDWKNLFLPSDGQFVVERDNDERIERLKERYAEIFKTELRTVKGVTAKLHLKDNVKPVFQKARPVPYALHPAVEKQLKKMEDEGIIEPVEVSNWATPIVCVPTRAYFDILDCHLEFRQVQLSGNVSLSKF